MKFLFSGFYILWLRLRGFSEHDIYQKITGDVPGAKHFYSR